jgi:uncharacterized protein (TIGR02687 family)
MMIEEKVNDYFQRYPNLKVLFFFDKDQEFLAEVQALQAPNVHVEIYANNPFTIKCRLVEELNNTKVLLYLPIAHPQSQDEYHQFPLLGLLLVNKELQLDHVGSFMETYNLQRRQKPLVQKYRSELKYTGVQEVCKTILTPENFNESALQKGLVASFLKFKQPERWTLLVAKLMSLAASKDETNLSRVIKKITDLNFEDVVVQQLKAVTGGAIQQISKESLLQLARVILYNKLTQTITQVANNDPYKNLKINDSSQLTILNQLLQDIERHPATKESFDKLLIRVSKEIKGEKLIEVYGENANFAEFNTDMIWAVMAKLQCSITTFPAEVIKSLENISLQANIEPVVKELLIVMIQMAKMQALINKMESYILNTPDEYIKAYTSNLYKVDIFYRRAIAALKEADLADIPIQINTEQLRNELNNSYDKHTNELNREWLKCLNHFKFDYNKIQTPKQYNFYKDEIEGAGQKVVVIISDALRYEAASELLAEMHADPKNTAKMRYMLASIPSKTNVGMAQLLPGEDKVFNNGAIKIDGISAESTYRTKILENYNASAKAISYEDSERLNQTDKRELYKNEVVYVYHDVIDSTGDVRKSERRTFVAVSEAIAELKKLVKNLHATNNVSKVFITADHGFLYNDQKIEEKDQEILPSIDVVLSHNRYYATISETKRDLGYTIPLSATTAFKDELFVTIPFSVNRYRKAGVGHQFVHGGGSLQELVIPLIESSRQRESVVNKVKPLLINKGNFRIVSNILKINILQENEVSRLEKERTISVGIYNNNQLVSNEEQFLLNFTSESPSERMVRVELTLAADADNEQFLKLKVFDIEDMLNPLIEERVQNNTLIQTDF